MHRFWDCAVPECPRAATIDIGGCDHCRSMFCAVHIKSKQHGCDTAKPLDDDAWLAAQTAELEALASKINEKALTQVAQDLSGGKACHLDPSDPLGRRLMGGMHIHRELLFDDGTVWLVRMLRENYTSFDDSISNAILLSECATLTWLAENVESIPAPRLHGFGLRVGVAYMLIDKLPGQPFEAHAATAEQTAKVLDQWAGMLCALGEQPLDKMGSLVYVDQTKGKSIVGPVAGDRTGTLPCTLGPFKDACSFYTAWADTHLDLISDGQLLSEQPVDAYVMFRWIKKQLATIPTSDAAWKPLNNGPFFLRHVDDKGDHLLVDDDYNITGVIDWTFARTAPAYEAFAPALVTADTNGLFSGTPGLSEADRVLGQALHRQQAPYSFFEADPMRRLLFGIGIGDNGGLFVWRSVSTKINDWQRLCALLDGQNLLASPLAPFQQAVTVPAFAVSVVLSARTTFVPYIASHNITPLDDDAWEQTITDEIEALLDMLNITALECRASLLRNGIRCSFQRSKHLGEGSMMGYANYHAWLVFDDDVRWLARLPRTTDGGGVPISLVNHLVASEYATLRWLEQHIPNVRVPRAYGYGLADDAANDVGVAYLLVEALPGRPFQAYEATTEQKRHVYSQYADILAEISRHPVKQASSLVTGDEDIPTEGPLASDRFVRLSQHGPYADAQSFYSSVADLQLDLIADGQIFYKYPREAFVFYRVLRDRAAPALSPMNDDAPPSFFLKHADDKGDHILVDGDYNITGIIDWQFARFVPAIEAFGASLVTADMGSLYDGKAGLGEDDKLMAALFREKCFKDLSRLASGSELARRFHFGLASGLSKDEAMGMLRAVLTLLCVDFGDDVSEWAAKEWEKAGLDNDPRWQRIEDSMNND
ncbi:hypothetical protein SBRCBS47491_008623 [Sporothrix bragantina]|uniref:AN1-type domain-containing protein n=1 Tax=Sporothrix bragantina TaxID=671064 RepID=A0ABP0CR43_9PEZI